LPLDNAKKEGIDSKNPLTELFSLLPNWVYLLLIQDEETGDWYKNKSRDFVVSLVDYIRADSDTSIIEPKRGFDFWPGFSKSLAH